MRIQTVWTNENELMTEYVEFSIPSNAQARAFKAAIKGKYSLTIDKGNCSKYSCFNFGTYRNGFSIKPTDYTISILDNVGVDSSNF